jgi:hypothetical protein
MACLLSTHIPTARAPRALFFFVAVIHISSCCGCTLLAPLALLYSMARKKAQRKQKTTLVPHRTPNLSALLGRAKSGDSRQAVKAYLDAGGSPMALVREHGSRPPLQLPLLHYMAFMNAHPH